jgi:hypothetical protein
MQLASNPTQMVVDNFLKRWETGDELVRNDFSNQLLAKLPRAADLDKLAGIDRSPTVQLHFIPRVLNNTGDGIVVEVQVAEIRTAGSPAAPISTLQLKLARQNRGWKIQQITARPLSNSSQR